MEKSYQKLIQGNKLYAETKIFQDPDYFKKLSQGQTPSYLWIGCSDSRVPANEITSTKVVKFLCIAILPILWCILTLIY